PTPPRSRRSRTYASIALVALAVGAVAFIAKTYKAESPGATQAARPEVASSPTVEDVAGTPAGSLAAPQPLHSAHRAPADASATPSSRPTIAPNAARPARGKAPTAASRSAKPAPNPLGGGIF